MRARLLATMPLIIAIHVWRRLGDFDNLTGFLKSVDPETGNAMAWDSTPARAFPCDHGRLTWYRHL